MGNPALGAVAVVGAIAAFGSFGVPIKSRRLQEAQVPSTHDLQATWMSQRASANPALLANLH